MKSLEPRSSSAQDHTAGTQGGKHFELESAHGIYISFVHGSKNFTFVPVRRKGEENSLKNLRWQARLSSR
jgi:hypothetical protein